MEGEWREGNERETNRGLKVEGCLGRRVRHARGRYYDDLEHVFAMECSLVHLLSDLDPLHRVALHILMSRTDRQTGLILVAEDTLNMGTLWGQIEIYSLVCNMHCKFLYMLNVMRD